MFIDYVWIVPQRRGTQLLPVIPHAVAESVEHMRPTREIGSLIKSKSSKTDDL